MSQDFDWLINDFGGKNSSVIAQFEAGNHDIVLPFSIVPKSDFSKPIKNNFDINQIVRASTIGDEKRLVDLIETFRNISPDYLDDGVELFKRMQDQSLEKDVVEYAKWDGFPNYNGISSIMIQPFNPFVLRGSVVEHPNIKDHYLINIVQQTDWSDRGITYQYLTDKSGNMIATSQFEGSSIDKELSQYLPGIVDLKFRSRLVGFIDSNYSSQVEFGIVESQNTNWGINKYEFQSNPNSEILFYQEREFLPFDFDESIDPSEYLFNTFGKLPKEGLELRVVKLETEKGIVTSNMEEVLEMSQDGIPSAYVFNGPALKGHLPINFMPNNMDLFFVPVDQSKSGNSLEHNTYRWIQKAKYSLMADPRWHQEFKNGEIALFK